MLTMVRLASQAARVHADPSAGIASSGLPLTKEGGQTASRDPKRLAFLPVIDTEPVRRFIRQHFLSTDEVLTEDQELFPTIIDSQGVVELADFVEEAYGIRLSEEDLRAYADNFQSLNSIAALIERKRM